MVLLLLLLLTRLCLADPRVMVMINADCETAGRLGAVVADTWARTTDVTVRMFIGDSAGGELRGPGRRARCTNDTAAELHLATYLPWCRDAYPPVEKVLCMWRFAHDMYGTRYTHFAKVDADTYVNVPNLLQLARDMPHATPLLAGMRGVGRGEERDAVRPFCMGAGYVATQALLLGLFRAGSGRAWERASEGRLPPNSDRAFSQVVEDALNVTCMAGVDSRYKWAFMNRYWDIDAPTGELRTIQTSLNKRMAMPMLHGYYSSWVPAVTVHPFKDPADMRRMHVNAQTARLPLFSHLSAAAAPYLKPLCVHNPARQYELAGTAVRECLARAGSASTPLGNGGPGQQGTGEWGGSRAEHSSAGPPRVTAHILYLPGRAVSSRRALNLSRALGAEGLEVRMHAGVDGEQMYEARPVDGGWPVPPLTPGELAVREGFARVFDAVLKDARFPAQCNRASGSRACASHAFFEDDAVLAPGFGQKLTRLIGTNARCGGFLTTPPGGALLLGGTVWRNGTWPRHSRWTSGWAQIDAETAALPSPHARRCYNVANATYGMFGFVMDVATVRLARTWLAHPEYAARPVDHVWAFLADAGVVVRALSPPLTIPQLDNTIIHTSARHTNVTMRTRLHRWQPWQ